MSYVGAFTVPESAQGDTSDKSLSKLFVPVHIACSKYVYMILHAV